MIRRATSVALIILTLVIAALAIKLSFRTTPASFDSLAWKAASEAQTDAARRTARGAMLDSVMNEKLVKGMSRQEVIAMLGTPDHVPRTDDCLMYYVGGASKSLMGGYTYLRLDFDPTERLTRWSVIKSD